MNSTAILHRLRRRRAIAALYRHATSSWPWWRHRANLADEPEQLALAELESYFWRAERQRPAR